MTKRNTTPAIRTSATWRRKDDEWFLKAAGRTYASIFWDYDHWSCFAVDNWGNSYDVGPAVDLARAKRFLTERFAPVDAPFTRRFTQEEAPL